MHIGKRIRDLRNAKGMKVTELARKAYISQPYLSDIEKGRTIPSLDKLTALCEALDISLSDFFGKTTDLSPELLSLIESAKQLTSEQQRALQYFIDTLQKD